MKQAEKILVVIIVVSLMLKLFHIPGGAMLSVVFVPILGMFYMGASYFLFKDDKVVAVENFEFKRTNPLRVLGSVATGISLSTTLTGILFRIMHWPGAAIILLTGLSSLVLIGLVSLFKYSKNKSSFYQKLGYRVAAIGGIALVAYLSRF
ncbi:MAG TPA: hypothetical protein VGB50_00610 [Flavobacterium sp.]|jgi:archaellum biogenesis protein FlaJ (TadC family)